MSSVEKKPRAMKFEHPADDTVSFPLDSSKIHEHRFFKSRQLEQYLLLGPSMKNKFRSLDDVHNFLGYALSDPSKKKDHGINISASRTKALHEEKNPTLYDQEYVKSFLGRPVPKQLDLYLNQYMRLYDYGQNQVSHEQITHNSKAKTIKKFMVETKDKAKHYKLVKTLDKRANPERQMKRKLNQLKGTSLEQEELVKSMIPKKRPVNLKRTAREIVGSATTNRNIVSLARNAVEALDTIARRPVTTRTRSARNVRQRRN